MTRILNCMLHLAVILGLISCRAYPNENSAYTIHADSLIKKHIYIDSTNHFDGMLHPCYRRTECNYPACERDSIISHATLDFKSSVMFDTSKTTLEHPSCNEILHQGMLYAVVGFQFLETDKFRDSGAAYVIYNINGGVLNWRSSGTTANFRNMLQNFRRYMMSG